MSNAYSKNSGNYWGENEHLSRHLNYKTLGLYKNISDLPTYLITRLTGKCLKTKESLRNNRATQSDFLGMELRTLILFVCLFVYKLSRWFLLSAFYQSSETINSTPYHGQNLRPPMTHNTASTRELTGVWWFYNEL